MTEAEAAVYWERNASRPGMGMEAPFFGPEKVSVLSIAGGFRTSMIVDPEDGRVPYTEEGRRRLKARMPASADGPESRGLNERCLGGFNRAPILTNAVGNLRQIVQTAESVVIWGDYNTEVRIIPLDGQRPAIGLFQGESRGRWDGETLVVETTRFRKEETARESRWALLLLTPQTTITERFTRISATEIAYTFTVEDELLYARPWTAESLFTRSDDHVLEFACHEGNYSLGNILSGGDEQPIGARLRFANDDYRRDPAAAEPAGEGRDLAKIGRWHAVRRSPWWR